MSRYTLALMVTSLCASGCAQEEISGNLFARGGVFDDWALNPVACMSGQPAGFRGVELCGDGGCARLNMSGLEGPTLTVLEPYPIMPRVFSSAKCDQFRITFERLPAYVEDVRVVAGRFDVECTAEPRALFGSITFAGCH